MISDATDQFIDLASLHEVYLSYAKTPEMASNNLIKQVTDRDGSRSRWQY